MAGHSLGEITALVCAGSLAFPAAVDLVRQRGNFMQSAVPVGEGAMAAIIGLDDDVINRVCAEVAGDEVVAAVNFNSPGQVVIAGHAGAVDRAAQACKQAGAKRALPLPVSAPFHTVLMRPAAEQLEAVLGDLHVELPAIPVVHNVAAQIAADPDEIRRLLVEQIYSPVQWVACVEAMRTMGVGATVECGPGSVLSGLNRRVSKALQVAGLETVAGLEKALAMGREGRESQGERT